MKAYSTTISKKEFVKELKKHQKADNFIKGRYFSEGRGCAVGCSLESISRVKGLQFRFDDHSLYPIHLGIPEWLARVEDFLFENISVERSKQWPVEFAQAINEGADLENIRIPFIIKILETNLVSLENVKFDAGAFPDVAKAVEGSKKAVKDMIEAHLKGDTVAAESAAWSARSAAWSARSAYWSAAWSAWSAAESAAESAWSAAWSAARSAYWSARSAARSAAESADCEKLADDLLEMLRKCK